MTTDKPQERHASSIRGTYWYLTKDGKRWGATVERERDWKTGKRVPLRKHGFRTQKEAMEWRVAEQDKRRRGDTVEPSMLPLGQWCDQWLAAQTIDKRPKSVITYRNRLALVTERIGSIPISRVTPEALNGVYADLLSRDYAPGYVGDVHRTIKAVFQRALENQMIVRNPAAVARPPANDRGERPSWTGDELRRFLDATAQDEPWGLIWRFIAETWVRVGELIDLRWDAVDLDAKTVRIERTITVNAKRQRVSSVPKTVGSRRTIPVSAELATLLRHHKDRSRFGTGHTDLVFPAPRTGGWLQQPAIGYALEQACEKAGVLRLTPHGIRHTGGSLAYADDVPLKIISERLGHANATITHNIYVHTDRDQHRAAAEQIGDLLKRRDKDVTSGVAEPGKTPVESRN